jgi:hypothetical protein
MTYDQATRAVTRLEHKRNRLVSRLVENELAFYAALDKWAPLYDKNLAAEKKFRKRGKRH